MEHGEFSALYRRWRAPLTLYAFSLTGEQAAAEDLVQSAFVKALLSYRGGGSIQAWLMRVLRNEWISSCRRPRMEALPEEVPSPCGDPLELLLRQEERRRVYEAVLALRPAYRDVLLQSAVVGLTDGEIARMLQTSEENVRQLRRRARAALRKALTEEDDEA